MTNNRIKIMSAIAVAIITLTAVSACKDQTATKDQAATGGEIPIVDVSTVQKTDLQNAADLLALDDEEGAKKIIQDHIDNGDRADLIDEFNQLWKGPPDVRNQRLAIIMAEELAAKRDIESAVYIAGLAYYSGAIVDKDFEKATAYWHRKRFENNKVIQKRLHEMYADPSSPVYDLDKAKLALAASTQDE